MPSRRRVHSQEEINVVLLLCHVYSPARHLSRLRLCRASAYFRVVLTDAQVQDPSMRQRYAPHLGVYQERVRIKVKYVFVHDGIKFRRGL